MPPSARSDEADEALLPNAETAIEAASPGPDSPEPAAAPGDEPVSPEPAPPGDEPALPAAAPRRRGRPPGSKNRPKPPPADREASVAADAATAGVDAVISGCATQPRPTTATPPAPRRRGRPPGRTARPSTPAVTRRERLTIEQFVAVDSPREPRLSPDGRRVAYTAEAGGARQVFVLELRSGLARQVTASEHAVSDPQWAPDGAWLAFVREKALWIVGLDGSRPTVVADHPAGHRSPRWSPDGRRIAFISRRRGWSQAWVIDAPLPRRGRPPAKATHPEPRALTPVGLDVEDLHWSPDGARLAVVAQRDPDLTTMQVTVVDVATGEERIVAGAGAWETSPRWLPDGSGLLVVSDRDGWFQVVRVPLDGGDRTVLTAGPADHGDYNGSFGAAPLPSPDGTHFVHSLTRDGLVELHVAPLVGALPAKRRPGRPPKSRPPEARPAPAPASARPTASGWPSIGSPTAAASWPSARRSVIPRTSGSSRCPDPTGSRQAGRAA